MYGYYMYKNVAEHKSQKKVKTILEAPTLICRSDSHHVLCKVHSEPGTYTSLTHTASQGGMKCESAFTQLG